MSVYNEVIYFISYKTNYSYEYSLFLIDFGEREEGREGDTSICCSTYYFLSSPKDMFIDFREREKVGGEKHTCERETWISCLPSAS